MIFHINIVRDSIASVEYVVDHAVTSPHGATRLHTGQTSIYKYEDEMNQDQGIRQLDRVSLLGDPWLTWNTVGRRDGGAMEARTAQVADSEWSRIIDLTA